MEFMFLFIHSYALQINSSKKIIKSVFVFSFKNYFWKILIFFILNYFYMILDHQNILILKINFKK